MSLFNYLGLVLADSEDDWPALVVNIRKEQTNWDMMSRVLVREGGNTQVSGKFFEALVQVVLIFGSETWVVTPCMGWSLGGFHHIVDRRITVRNPRRLQYRSWE